MEEDSIIDEAIKRGWKDVKIFLKPKGSVDGLIISRGKDYLEVYKHLYDMDYNRAGHSKCLIPIKNIKYIEQS